jgi:FAD-dependent urate hydroxylase
MKEEGGEVVITTINGRIFRTDFVILGTGFSIDPMNRNELASYQDKIACWEDRYTAPPSEGNAELGRFPWLNDDFSFTEKEVGTAPWLRDIHCFNYAASVSVGKVSGDIPAISEGALWLARGVAASLFIRDIDYHWEALLAYEKPELETRRHRYRRPPERRPNAFTKQRISHDCSIERRRDRHCSRP